MKVLDIWSCYKIKTIPLCPNLKELKISCCDIKQIPYYPNLKILEILFSEIKVIPYYPKLEILFISNANIKEIPYFPNLKKLKIECCQKINKIIINDKVHLNIWYCSELILHLIKKQ